MRHSADRAGLTKGDRVGSLGPNGDRLAPVQWALLSCFRVGSVRAYSELVYKEFGMTVPRLCVLMVAMALVLGCGRPESKSIKPAGGTTPAEQLKFALQNVATTGEASSSAFGEVLEKLQALKAADAAKAGAVENDIKELGKLTDPAKIKAKAKANLSRAAQSLEAK